LNLFLYIIYIGGLSGFTIRFQNSVPAVPALPADQPPTKNPSTSLYVIADQPFRHYIQTVSLFDNRLSFTLSVHFFSFTYLINIKIRASH
jgi:hypothetical protein